MTVFYSISSIMISCSFLLVSLFATVSTANNQVYYGSRIFRGFNATKGQIAHQALLLIKSSTGHTDFCGGALISVKHVLTAAHCIKRDSIRGKVYLGVTSTKDGNDVVIKEVGASDMVSHPDYNPNNFENDIALIKLPDPVSLTGSIQTIALPKSSWIKPSIFDNLAVTASGWGETYDDESGIHPNLQFSSIRIMPHSECASHYKKVLPITDGMICTEKNSVHSGPCRGDSGGPLSASLRSGTYLIGVVSWTVGQCSGTEPIVYTNVVQYLSWISSITDIETS